MFKTRQCVKSKKKSMRESRELLMFAVALSSQGKMSAEAGIKGFINGAVTF